MGFWRGEWQRFLDFRPVERAFFWLLVAIHLFLWGWQWYQNRWYEMDDPVAVAMYKMVRGEDLTADSTDFRSLHKKGEGGQAKDWTRIPSSGGDSGVGHSFGHLDSSGYRLFYFDPNAISSDSLRLLGVPVYAVRNWVRYRQAGGKFYRSKDLLKIYGMDTSVYERIRPYVRIRSTRVRQPKRSTRIIEINAADTADWMQLPGIGKVFSRRILRFREALGGFYSVAQVAETYGLPDSTFEKIRPFLRCQPQLRQLDLNKASEKALSRHPYINKREARLIVRYRQQNGPFRDVAELKALYGLDTHRLKKYLPYLCVECDR